MPALAERIAWTHHASPQLADKERGIGSTAKDKLDMPEIEAKWQAKWSNRPVHMMGEVSAPIQRSYSPLSPFYLQHLRKPTTILETLQWHWGKSGTNIVIKGHTLFDKILHLSRSESADLGAHIRKCGADVIRTSLIFHDKTAEDLEIDQAGIEGTQQWFESIWEAVASAHGSYIGTQVCPDDPDVPEALGEPGLERWLDYISNEHLQWVQVPPGEPEVSSTSTDDDTYRLWVAAQNAILAYTAPISARNNVQAIRSRLVRLMNAITAYEDAEELYCDMHYYSARVLVSLLAPLAPSLAEECWVLLHYGSQDGDDDGGTEPRYEFEDAIEELIKETEDLLGRRHLPRQGRPDTLQSIFDQPFPVAKSRAIHQG